MARLIRRLLSGRRLMGRPLTGGGPSVHTAGSSSSSGGGGGGEDLPHFLIIF